MDDDALSPPLNTTSGATKTFEMDGRGYRADAETLDVLRSVVPAAKASGDVSAVAALMHLGLQAGRIREIG